MILRACSGALATALAGSVALWQADLFTINTQGGTVYRWTTWDLDLRVGGNTFLSKNPWLSRGRWAVKNTMEVPTLELFIDDQSTVPFLGGSSPSLRGLLHNGYFDGASVTLERVYMPAGTSDTTTYGTIVLFKGDLGKISPMSVARTSINVRGKNTRLAVLSPRNVYQPGCLHTFCDAGCTLSAATFTASFTVAASGGARTSVGFLGTFTFPMQDGTLTMTSGPAAGQSRNIIQSLPGGGGFVAILADPLTVAPNTGDSLTIFAGCDKTVATCTSPYANLVNFRGFPFIPAPNTTAPGG